MPYGVKLVQICKAHVHLKHVLRLATVDTILNLEKGCSRHKPSPFLGELASQRGNQQLLILWWAGLVHAELLTSTITVTHLL